MNRKLREAAKADCRYETITLHKFIQLFQSDVPTGDEKFSLLLDHYLGFIMAVSLSANESSERIRKHDRLKMQPFCSIFAYISTISDKVVNHIQLPRKIIISAGRVELVGKYLLRKALNEIYLSSEITKLGSCTTDLAKIQKYYFLISIERKLSMKSFFKRFLNACCDVDGNCIKLINEI